MNSGNDGSSKIINVQDLNISIRGTAATAPVVQGVNFHIDYGETLALVGESGCGKSLTAKSIVGLLPSPPVYLDAGRIWFEGRDLAVLPKTQFQSLRGRKIGIVFQDPMTFLSPFFTVGNVMRDVLIWRNGLSGAYRRLLSRKELHSIDERIVAILEAVGMPAPREMISKYPFQLSGGMRQRVLIAMALLGTPQLLIADEPGSALDVTIQDQIINLLDSLARKSKLAVLYITHDLGVAKRVADRVAVMYAGTIAEIAPSKELFEHPLHPYTQGLLDCVPTLSGHIGTGIPGTVSSYDRPPSGCRFHPRCHYRLPVCSERKPSLISKEVNHEVGCWLYS